MIRSIIGVFPNLDQLDMGMVMNYGWLALAGIVANILLYFLGIFSCGSFVTGGHCFVHPVHSGLFYDPLNYRCFSES